MIKPCPNFHIDRKILHLGVCAQMSISIMNVFVTFRGLRFVSNIYWSLLLPLKSRYVTVTSYIRGDWLNCTVALSQGLVPANDIHPKF